MSMKASKRGHRGSVLFGVAGGIALVSSGLLAAYLVTVQDASASATGEVVAADVSPKAMRAVEEAAERYLASDLVLRFDGREIAVARADLGASVDDDALAREARRLSAGGADLGSLDYLGYKGDLVPVSIDRDAAEGALRELKDSLDRAPVNARLDLENREVVREEPGMGVDLFGSVSAVETAVRSGAAEVELEGAVLPPSVTVESLGIEDISEVIGTFTTKFSVAERTRNDNLKLLASMLDGHVLQPGETFSFNEITGERTMEDGFKMAHVITAGELVDGMAGGSCQISTTLHGAAFFAGLEIVRSLPHSRPSTYVTMGLDATVVANMVDLQLRNPYEFPVVIHYKVARGEATVELLGKEKPFDKVEFEREIVERLPFETVTREDMEIGVGHMVVDQPGYPGYKLKRIRRIYKDGKVLRTDKWNLRYKPVIEYARIGINPNPNLPPPKQKKGHGPKPADKKVFRMVQ